MISHGGKRDWKRQIEMEKYCSEFDFRENGRLVGIIRVSKIRHRGIFRRK